MSIHNLFDKIKSKFGIDNTTILYLCIIVGVGVSSFGLGRLSVNNRVVGTDNTSQLRSNQSLLENSKNDLVEISIQSEGQREKRYVASKNGKMYYSLGCSGAKRIKPENEVWFSTSEEAEKSGYQLSLMCK
jgi:hypothetical protein